jgi:anti-sigma regulatory factor (Ser/Thr protein kinase)
MQESLTLTTKGGKDAPARVRAALTALNGGLGEKSEDVRLLATELVTNAVVHAGVDHERYLHFALSAPLESITATLEYPGEPFTGRRGTGRGPFRPAPRRKPVGLLGIRAQGR